MKDVIISIKPQYYDQIVFGNKNYEFRKSIWKEEVRRVYLYVTKPAGMVKGFFKIERILKGTPEALWLHCNEEAGISENDFFAYYEGCELGHAIKIGMVALYKNGMSLEELQPNLRAPQNFQYLPIQQEKGATI